MAFDLSSLSSSTSKRGVCNVIYGVGGVGKTTVVYNACADRGGVIILGEDGVSTIENRLGGGVKRTPIVNSWQQFMEIIKFFAKEKHDFKLIAIDTIDSVTSLLDKHVVDLYYGGDAKKADAFKAKYEDYGREFGIFLKGLSIIQERGIDVDIICHSSVVNVKDPDCEPYQKFDLALPGGGKHVLSEKLYDYADNVMFARFDTVSTGDKRAISKGRVVKTEWSASYAAKSRSGIPDGEEFSWESLKKYI